MRMGHTLGGIAYVALTDSDHLAVVVVNVSWDECDGDGLKIFRENCVQIIQSGVISSWSLSLVSQVNTVREAMSEKRN